MRAINAGGGVRVAGAGGGGGGGGPELGGVVWNTDRAPPCWVLRVSSRWFCTLCGKTRLWAHGYPIGFVHFRTHVHSALSSHSLLYDVLKSRARDAASVLRAPDRLHLHARCFTDAPGTRQH